MIVGLQVSAHHNNDFEIFRTSWLNLVAHRDLYGASDRHRDFFLYSPTFAFLFAPFAVLPTWAGTLLWSAVNAGTLYFSLGRALPPHEAFAARAIVFLDTVGSMQQAQSNALVAGLMILAFAELERNRQVRAAATVALGTAIKIFPIVAAVFAVFRPYRLPRFVVASVVAAAILIGTPLLVSAPAELIQQYRAWFAAPSPVERGFSVMEQLRIWFGRDIPVWPVQLIGAGILLSPLVQVPHWASARFRLLFLASVLMFCVLFNHAAESPSFVIAVAGVGIWFALSARDRESWAILAIVFAGTVLASSDAMPEVLQRNLFEPYRLKTLPILLVWLLTQAQLWRRSVSAPFQASESARAAPVT